MKKLAFVVVTLALIGSLIANFLLFRRYSSKRPLMTVAGQPITRQEYQDQLDYKFGKQVLTKLAFRKMIDQAAAKAGVTPTDKDVDERIAEIERRNPAMLNEAKQDANKMAEAREDLKSDLALENLRVKDVKMSDAEIAAFYEHNRAAFTLPAQAQTTLAVAANSVDAETAKSLLAQGMKPELVARQPRIRVIGIGGYQLPAQLPKDVSTRLNSTVFHMKQGDVATVPVGKAFIIIRLNSNNSPGVPPLQTVKPLVTRIAKLSKAASPTDTLVNLYKDSNVTFEVDKYAPYFAEIQDRASKADAPKATAEAPKSSGTVTTPPHS